MTCVVIITLCARWWLRRKYRRNLSFGSIDDGDNRLSGKLLQSAMAEMVTLHEDPHSMYHDMDSGSHDGGGLDVALDIRAEDEAAARGASGGRHADTSGGSAVLASTARPQPTTSSGGSGSAGIGRRVSSLRTVLRRKSATTLLPQAGAVRPASSTSGDLGDGGL